MIKNSLLDKPFHRFYKNERKMKKSSPYIGQKNSTLFMFSELPPSKTNYNVTGTRIMAIRGGNYDSRDPRINVPT